MQKWEYKVLNLELPLSGELVTRLAPLGEDGYELTSTVRGNHGVTFLFKRPKAEKDSETLMVQFGGNDKAT